MPIHLVLHISECLTYPSAPRDHSYPFGVPHIQVPHIQLSHITMPIHSSIPHDHACSFGIPRDHAYSFGVSSCLT